MDVLLCSVVEGDLQIVEDVGMGRRRGRVASDTDGRKYRHVGRKWEGG